MITNSEEYANAIADRIASKWYNSKEAQFPGKRVKTSDIIDALKKWPEYTWDHSMTVGDIINNFI